MKETTTQNKLSKLITLLLHRLEALAIDCRLKLQTSLGRCGSRVIIGSLIALPLTLFLSCNAFCTSYSISYNDSVVGNMPTDTNGRTSGSSVLLASNIPTLAEYRFIGWCLGTSSSSSITTTSGVDSCSGTTYLAGGNLPISDSGNNTNYLYAMWANNVEVAFTFDSGVSSVTVNGTTLSASGSTVALDTNSPYTITVNYANGYMANTMVVASGDATLSGTTLTTGVNNATVNITSKLKPVFTFNFDSNVSSVTVNGTALSTSGSTVVLDPNSSYTITVNYASGYMANNVSIATGDATVNQYRLTTGNSNSTVSITSQPAASVNVTFTFSNVTSVAVNGETISSSGGSVSLMGGSTYTVTVTPASNYTLAATGGTITSGSFYSISNVNTSAKTFDLTVGNNDGAVTINTAQCITADTLIALASGEKKRVADLSGDEELLVWDFDTASYAVAPIVFIEPEPEAEYRIIHLFFEDETGTAKTDIEISYEHGFFDYTLGKFIHINEDNPERYLGHEFIMQDGNTYKTAKLTDIKHESKVTSLYGLTTYKYFNFFNNDLLSIEGNINGMFNYFDVDKSTMGYDQAKKQADIEKYGLLTYEDFNGMIDEFGFEAYNGQYLAVSIGKGLTTWEDIKALADYYGHFTAGHANSLERGSK